MKGEDIELRKTSQNEDSKHYNNFQFIVNKLSKGLWMTFICIMMFIIVGAAILVYFFTGNRIGIKQTDITQMTPTQIQSIKAIGEWEFLTVYDEEIVDTVRTGFFGDDELVRIYYGTLRLGIDMNDVGNEWMKSKGDSVVVTLPEIKLLDEHFIDEARTVSFFESGTWNDETRQRLYLRAASQMKQRCMNKENVMSAKRNAVTQFGNFMRAMGFENVSIRFEK